MKTFALAHTWSTTPMLNLVAAALQIIEYYLLSLAA
jgi:hypothetical protein